MISTKKYSQKMHKLKSYAQKRVLSLLSLMKMRQNTGLKFLNYTIS